MAVIKKPNTIDSGTLYVTALLALVTFGSAGLSGGIAPNMTLDEETTPITQNAYACCDSGSGSACQPSLGATFTYAGDTYALLKSNISQTSPEHLQPTTQTTPDGRRIFINTSNETARHNSDQCPKGMDLIGKHDPSLGTPFTAPFYGGCIAIPDEQLIYVCNASQAECNKNFNTQTVPFDVYYRIKDGPVPDEIASSCPAPPETALDVSQKIVNAPSPSGTANLQLETFQIEQSVNRYEWLDAWCKPAIYLYPEEKTAVNVKVAPQGKFTLTIPKYPKDGWDVIADPDGKIIYEKQIFPYLYWEASIPDSLINEPKYGYAVAFYDLPGLFTTLLPQLGLNAKETKEFREYWLKALPKSPYYFVGVMPQSEINTLAPLTITPRPDSVLRVTLYFKALEQKTFVSPPDMTPFTRKGFTVTEWGGFFKADKNHPGFTCLM